MECSHARALIPSLACELLEAAEATAARRHTAACPECARELSRLGELFGVLGGEEVDPPEDVWRRIEEALAHEVVDEAEGAPADAGAEPLVGPAVGSSSGWASRAASLDAPADSVGSGVWAPHADSRSGEAEPAAAAPSKGGDDPLTGALDDGRRFGDYEILGELGRGGMGVVYRARHAARGELVALKVLKAGEQASPRQVRRFLRETQAAAKLEHPNLVGVRETGCHAGHHFFTMELVEGEPLDAVVRRGERLPLPRVVEVVAAVAAGVDHAHAQGIVHRDLKPANVLLAADGTPKVTDFGLAKDVDHRSMLTRTEPAVGTPYYMPPEQARGRTDLDRRADVYALGVILYELLTLERPFQGATAMEVYHRILEEEPVPPSRLDPRVDAALDAIVLTAMAKERAQRFASARALAEDLARYARGEAVRARRPGPELRVLRWARRRRAAAAAAASVCLATGLGAAALGVRAVRLHVLEEQALLQRGADDPREAELVGLLAAMEEGLAEARAHLARGEAGLARRLAADAREELHAVGAAGLHGAWEALAVEAALVEARALAQLAGPAEAGDPRWEEALNLLRAAGPAPALDLEAARVEVARGRPEAARTLLEALLVREPEHAAARLELGAIHLALGAPAAAEAELERVLASPARGGDAGRAHLLRGRARFALGRYAEARADLDRAVELEPDAQAFLWRGRVLRAMGRDAEARDDLTEAIDLAPELPDAYCERGELHRVRRELDDARDDFEVALMRDPDHAPAALGLGRALAGLLELEAARQHLQAAAWSGDPQVSAAAWLALGDLRAFAADPLLARREAEARHVRAGPEGPGPGMELDELEAAAAEVRREQLAGADRAYARALERDPDLTEAHLARARLALAQDEPAAARAALAEAAEAVAAFPREAPAAPAPPEEDDGWTDEAWVEVAPTARPTRPTRLRREALALTGLLAWREGAWDEAEAAFVALEEAAPAAAAAAAGRALLAWRAGDRARARALGAEARRRAAADVTTEAGWWFSEGRRHAERARRSWQPDAYAAASAAWARAAILDPLHGLARLERGRLAASWADWDAAAAAAREAVEVDPTARAGHELEGFLYARDLPEERDPETGWPAHVRDPDRARAAFDRALALAVSPGEAFAARYGRALASLGADDAAARADLEAAVAALPDRQATGLDAATAEELALAREALDLLSAVCARAGDEGALAAARARRSAFEEAVAVAAQRSLQEATVLRDRQAYSEALDRFDRAVALAPGRADARYGRATCYLKIGNFVPGILDFARAVELDARFVDQVYNKVYQISYVVDLNRVITELNEIVSDRPREASALFLRGFFYVAKTEFQRYEPRDLELGRADFTRALELNPGFVAARLYRAELTRKAAGLAEDPAERRALLEAARVDVATGREQAPESSLGAFLEALQWSVESAEEGLGPAARQERVDRALEALEEALERGVSLERARASRDLDPVRGAEGYAEILRRAEGR